MGILNKYSCSSGLGDARVTGLGWQDEKGTSAQYSLNQVCLELRLPTPTARALPSHRLISLHYFLIILTFPATILRIWWRKTFIYLFFERLINFVTFEFFFISEVQRDLPKAKKLIMTRNHRRVIVNAVKWPDMKRFSIQFLESREGAKWYDVRGFIALFLSQCFAYLHGPTKADPSWLPSQTRSEFSGNNSSYKIKITLVSNLNLRNDSLTSSPLPEREKRKTLCKKNWSDSVGSSRKSGGNSRNLPKFFRLYL